MSWTNQIASFQCSGSQKMIQSAYHSKSWYSSQFHICSIYPPCYYSYPLINLIIHFLVHFIFKKKFWTYNQSLRSPSIWKPILSVPPSKTSWSISKPSKVLTFFIFYFFFMARKVLTFSSMYMSKFHSNLSGFYVKIR